MAQPLMELHTSFGDKLKFRSMTASEELGRLYEFSVVAIDAPRSVGAGKHALVVVETTTS